MSGLTEVLNYQQDMADELVQREPEKVKKLKRQKKELTDKCEEKEEQLEGMKKTLQEMKVAFESKETENKEIKEAMLELNDENSLLKARLKEKENNLFKKEDEILDLEHEAEELKNKTQKDQTCIAQQASVICNQEATIEQMEVDAVKKDLRIWGLKQEMKEANTKVIKEVAEITVQNVIREAGDMAQMLNLENKNVSLRSEIESLMQKTERLEKLVTELQDNAQKIAATAESKIRVMADEIQGATKRAETSEKMTNELESCLNETTESLAKAMEQIEVTMQEKDAILVSLKEKDQALKWQLRENKQIRYEVDIQDTRIENMAARLKNIAEICFGTPELHGGSEERLDQMIERIKGMQETLAKVEVKKKPFVKRLFKRFRNANRL